MRCSPKHPRLMLFTLAQTTIMPALQSVLQDMFVFPMSVLPEVVGPIA